AALGTHARLRFFVPRIRPAASLAASVYLSCSPHHRDPPSFPTRRSSDLPREANGGGMIGRKELRVLAIGAHLDDIELGCGGALVRAARAGHCVRMICLSDSSYTNYD